MKKALIISCNDSYDYDTRTKYVCDFLKINGYQVKFLVADFDHRKKTAYWATREDDITYIPVRPYMRNLSLDRILSHIQFAKGVRKYIECNEADLVYHCAPPNATIKVLADVKKKKAFKLITEIGDVWPETMPVGNSLKMLAAFPFKIWSNLRDKNLYNSDLVIAECDLFNALLREKSGAENIRTIYFCKPFLGTGDVVPSAISDGVVLSYLGSINNIVDIKIIGMLIQALSTKRKTVLHIIGDGERRQEMIDNARENGGEVCFHGMIFDDAEKQAILGQSHFALNVMKQQVCVGMTMKSLDYFSYGIPMINNIGGDIKKIVDEEQIGYNVNFQTVEHIASEILELTEEDYSTLRMRVCMSHSNYFSVNRFNKALAEIINQTVEV